MKGFFCQICKNKKNLTYILGSKFCFYCLKKTSNDVYITVSDVVTTREGFSLKAKSPFFKRFKFYLISGWQKSQKTKNGVDRYRSFDKEKDLYDEIIKDYKTGQVIHEHHEKLSEHTGHGSARKKLTRHAEAQ